MAFNGYIICQNSAYENIIYAAVDSVSIMVSSVSNQIQKLLSPVGCRTAIRAPLCRRPLVISLSLSPFFRPSFCPGSLLQSISSPPLAHSGLYFTDVMLFGKECAEILDYFCTCRSKVIAELFEKFLSGAFLFFLWFIWLILY